MQSPTTMIDYELISPPADLSGYVKFYWTLRSLPNDGTHYIFRTMANGCPVLFFHYHGDVHECATNSNHGSSFQAGIYGATEKIKRFMLPKNFGVFGVCLYPFAVPMLFNVPSSEIANQVVNLTELMGSGGKDLGEQVIMCEHNSSRINLVSGFIRSKIPGMNTDIGKFSHAISNVIHSKGQFSIPELADGLCLSRRTFERRFREFSGLSPKTYSNIIRFQSSIDELAAQNSSLTEIAYQSGYYDQSHFTNEFRRFSGFNPKSFATNDSSTDNLWLDFVAFFQFLSWCPAVLCSGK